uniref:phosphoribosylglycinamide formyltransferase n=1 Tax=Roseivirga sp. TaxID=1964215 RepID=UPI0040485F50
MDLKKKIAVFASGNGTNAERVFEHFKEHPQIEVAMLFSNNASAGVLNIAAHYKIPTVVFNRSEFYDSNAILNQLIQHEIDWVVLAGFMWLVPESLVKVFPNKIVNIHPALLPKFGGKGMYGMHVHEAVKAANETISGISIHFVNQQYDEGSIIAQYSCKIEHSDNAAEIAKKVQRLEHENYPKVIEELVLNQV